MTVSHNDLLCSYLLNSSYTIFSDIPFICQINFSEHLHLLFPLPWTLFCYPRGFLPVSLVLLLNVNTHWDLSYHLFKNVTASS